MHKYYEAKEILSNLNEEEQKKLLLKISQIYPSVIINADRELNPPEPEPPWWTKEVERLILKGRVIDAIKCYRNNTGCTLYEAKDECDNIRLKFKML